MVAFSGGADSLALLCAFLAIKDDWALEVAAAHLDHGLRGEDSRADAEWAEAFCQSRGVVFFRGYWPGYREVKPGQSPEIPARTARRHFLEAMLEKWPGDAIALGHHLDDQSETVLIHLLNGAGLRGMGGMQPVQGPYIRPLLDTRRTQILDYIKELGLSPRHDASNEDTAYLRNRLRLQILPVLKECNPGFAAAAGRMAALARQEDAFLDGLAEKALAKLDHTGRAPAGAAEQEKLSAWRILAGLKPDKADMPGLSLRGFASLDPVVARRALRLWIIRQTGITGIDMAGTERAYQLAFAGRAGAQAEIAGGVRIQKERDLLVIAKTLEEGENIQGDDMAASVLHKVKPGDAIPIAGGKAWITVDWAGGAIPLPARPDGGFSCGTTEMKAFDRYECDWPDQGPAPGLRYRRAGDWVWMPYGRKKLKDIFIEKGVPRGLRGALPVLALDAQVLWVPGVVKASSPHGGGPGKPDNPAEKRAEFTCFTS